MSLREDIAGVPLTSCSQEAVESFNKGLTATVTMRESALPWFKAALEKDEDFVMAHCMVVGLKERF